jgi:hypothetical protein
MEFKLFTDLIDALGKVAGIAKRQGLELYTPV